MTQPESAGKGKTRTQSGSKKQDLIQSESWGYKLAQPEAGRASSQVLPHEDP